MSENAAAAAPPSSSPLPSPCDVIVAAAEALQRSSLVSLPCPYVAALRDFMIVDPYGVVPDAQPLPPRSGDLLVEVSTRREPARRRVGVLTRVRRHATSRYDDRWTLQRIDDPGGEITWRDATFVRIPTTAADHAWIDSRADAYSRERYGP